MAFLTIADARNSASDRPADVIQKSLRASAAAAPTGATFNVFLSHCIRDAKAVEGLKCLLERSGLSVYVDWIEDPELDRVAVNVRTAARLRERLRHSESLVFATSEASPSSKWMPWELGYFDGFRPDRVAVLPVTATATSSFISQEYLRLYPYFENVGPFLRELGMHLSDGSTLSVREFVRSGAHRVA